MEGLSVSYSGDSPVLGYGTVSGAGIDAWFAANGPSAASQFAPDRTYKPAPVGLGAMIIRASHHWEADGAVADYNEIAADIAKESAFWQSAIVRAKNNPSGLGAENDDPMGKAVTFDTPYEGILATVAHWLTYAKGKGPWNAYDPRYAAVEERGWLGVVVRLRDLNGRWAWPGETYGQGIATLANALVNFAKTVEEPTMPKIALASGHHNTSGGDAHETVQTGQLTPVIAAACRARGMDVRVITPDEGRGMYPGTLYDAAYQVVTWANEGWTANAYVEVHTEGNSAGDKGRGAFAIYPDWVGDLDTDVRDNLGPDIVRRLKEKTGLPARGNGVMSEKQTGVGIDGSRLGVFRATESVKAQTTRAIVEYGSHTSPADLALWAKPDFLQNAADATADALAIYTGAQPVPEPAPSPATKLILPGQGSESPDIYPPNVGLQLGFNGVYLAMGAAKYANDPALGILTLTGWAKEDEWEGVDGCVYQRFHRVTLQYDPRNAQPWDIVQMHPDTDLPERKV